MDDRRLAVPLDLAVLFDALPTPYVVMSRDLVIVQANQAYLEATGRERDDVLRRPLFEAFPLPDSALDEHGDAPTRLVLERVVASGQPEPLPAFRYDISGPDGSLVERYWSMAVTPVLDDAERTEFVVIRLDDLTDFVRERERGRRAQQVGEGWRQRVGQVEADLFAQAQELAAALAAREAAAGQAAALADVALALTTAQSVQDVERVVFSRGLSAVGVQGGAIILPNADGDGDRVGGRSWRLSISSALGEHVRVVYGELPPDSPMPGVEAARTGRPVLLPDRASGLAFTPEMAQVYADTGRDGWAFLPLILDGHAGGCLALSWVGEHEVTAAELELLEGFAAQCSQALLRIRAAAAERNAASQVLRLAEQLQQALLTPPPQPPGLQIAVRYTPAADQAQVGGDWYDAFVQPDGATSVVIGDVVGHDARAAASMGQLRGLLRGLAYDVDPKSPLAPAAVLSRLEHVAAGLDLKGLATVVLARIEPADGTSDGVHDGAAAGPGRRITWSNAGHLPPVLLRPDGSNEVLETPSDLLLGVELDSVRRDHTVVLPPGATLLLFTDGLVERRAATLDDGLAQLQAVASRLPADGALEEFCDRLLHELAPDHGEDDVALVAVRSDRSEGDDRASGSRSTRAVPVTPAATLTLAPDPAAVRLARRFVNEQCAQRGLPGETCDSAVLMVSETVTNAFVHGRSEARITITSAAGRLRVEVADDNSRHPRAPQPDDEALDGRGITIIDTLASRWGVEDDTYGKTVWFEV